MESVETSLDVCCLLVVDKNSLESRPRGCVILRAYMLRADVACGRHGFAIYRRVTVHQRPRLLRRGGIQTAVCS